MGELGFELTGQSVITAKEAAKSRKAFFRGHSEILHFQSKSGHRVELWVPVDVATKALRVSAPLLVEKADFHESDHPRRDDGRFIGDGELDEARADPSKVAALRARVTDPEQRKKLDAHLRGRPPTAGGDSAASAHARKLVTRIGTVPAAVRRKVGRFVKGRYDKLASRYGHTGAKAILAAAVLMTPLPLPGTTLIPVAFAEIVLRLRRAITKADALDADTIRKEARLLLADLYEHMGESPPD